MYFNNNQRKKTMFIEIDNDKLGKVCIVKDSIMMVTKQKIVTISENVLFGKEHDIMKLFCQLNDIGYKVTAEDIVGNEEYFEFMLFDGAIFAKKKISMFVSISEESERTIINLPGNNWDDDEAIEINCPYNRFKEIMNNTKSLEIPEKFSNNHVRISLSTEKIVKLVCGPFNKYVNVGDDIKQKMSTSSALIAGISRGGSEDSIKFNEKESSDDTIVWTLELGSWSWTKGNVYDYEIWINIEGKEYKIDYVKISLDNEYNVWNKTVTKKFDGGEIKFN